MRRTLIKSATIISMALSRRSLVAQGDGETNFSATVGHLERMSDLGEPIL